jgi:predicted amidohydrolase
MRALRVTLLQQPLAWHDPAANREHFAMLLGGLAGRADLVVLPETFTTGFSMQAESLAEAPGEATTEWLMQWARRLDAVITGSLITREGGRCYNRLLWVTPSGEVRHYDKRHLFRLGREHEHFTAGRGAWSLEWRGLRICPLVCYDLRFPVFSRRRPELDYDLLVYVANWPAVRTEAWRLLLRARAVENQSYVIGVNRVGADGNGVPHAGDSAAIDFLGRPLAEAGDAAAVINVELDPAPLAAFRQKFPAHLDADRFTLEL